VPRQVSILVGSAIREPLGTLRREWLALSKRGVTKKAGKCFPDRLKGVTQMIQSCVVVFEKGLAILCRPRLVLNHLGNAEPINTNLTAYESSFVFLNILLQRMNSVVAPLRTLKDNTSILQSANCGVRASKGIKYEIRYSSRLSRNNRNMQLWECF